MLERDRLGEALRSSRLVTVWGAGGVGKSRLVQETQQGWPGGVLRCDLGAARSALEVAQVVGGALGVRLLEAPLSQLGKALRARGRALLVLDHLEASAEQTVGSWLEAAPALQVLVTSRRALGLRGELALELQGAGWPLETLSESQRQALARLCVFAGGFSLQAAEAIGVHTVRELHDWLHRAGPERFAMAPSLREYAASQLADPLPIEELHGAWFARQDLAPDLANAKVACERALRLGDAQVAGQTALVAWKILRQTGPVQLALQLVDPVLAMPGLTAPLRAELHLVAAKARDLVGSPSEAGVHVESALAHAREAGDRGLRARALAQLAVSRYTEPGRALRALLEAHALAHELGLGSLEGSLENVRASWLVLQGRPEEARDHFERALALFEELGDEAGAGMVLGNLGNLDSERGRFAEARARYGDARQAALTQGDLHSEAQVLFNLLVMEKKVGTPQAVREVGALALRAMRQLGDRAREGYVLRVLGSAALADGELDEAASLGQRAYAISEEVLDAGLRADALHLLAEVAHGRGQGAVARERVEAALQLRRTLGDRRGLAQDQHLQSLLAGDEGGLTEALHLLRELGEPLFEARVLGDLARLKMAQGRLSEAEADVDAALARLEGSGASRALAEALCVRAELEKLRSDPESSRASTQRAAALARLAEAGPASELQRRLDALGAG